MTPLEHLRQQGLYRERHVITARLGEMVEINQQKLINFCSSDYLGLATDDALKQATIAAIEQYGVGSGASAMVSGYYDIHQRAEAAFAEFLNRDQALLFNSGFMANMGVMGALLSAKDTVAMDKLNHASLIDGLKFSGATHLRYRHADVAHLQQRLKDKLNYIITEGVFSMEGDLAPLPALEEIAHQQQAQLLVDDAHGIGVFGQHGGGVVEHFGLTQQQVPLLICPLGKAFASQGAMVAGTAALMEEILQFSRTYRYSTALPPMLAATCLAALHLVKTQSWRREALQERIMYFKTLAKQHGLPCLDSISPIQSIILGDNQRALVVSEQLFKKGFFVKAIRPPTVPVNTARLRITLNVTHTLQHIQSFVTAIAHETA